MLEPAPVIGTPLPFGSTKIIFLVWAYDTDWGSGVLVNVSQPAVQGKKSDFYAVKTPSIAGFKLPI